MLSTPQGPADLEVTVEEVHVLRGGEAGAVVHTNHCLHPNLVTINREFPELIQSYGRLRRIQGLIDSCDDRQPALKHLQALLQDHEGYPRSICRHANDDPATGFWQTVFSVIIEPAQRRMQISRGTPCEHPYETYELT
jgi:isopenicillin-N N-acyltransferase-like protein